MHQLTSRNDPPSCFFFVNIDFKDAYHAFRLPPQNRKFFRILSFGWGVEWGAYCTHYNASPSVFPPPLGLLQKFVNQCEGWRSEAKVSLNSTSFFWANPTNVNLAFQRTSNPSLVGLYFSIHLKRSAVRPGGSPGPSLVNDQRIIVFFYSHLPQFGVFRFH